MTIEIIESVLVHEAMIFRFMGLRTAGREGFGHEDFHCGTTLTRQANQRMANFRHVGNLLRS